MLRTVVEDLDGGGAGVEVYVVATIVNGGLAFGVVEVERPGRALDGAAGQVSGDACQLRLGIYLRAVLGQEGERTGGVDADTGVAQQVISLGCVSFQL